jgi:vancomycin resistance protein YoaR
VRDLVALIKKKAECKPANARVDWKTFKIVPHKNGHKMNEKKSLAELERALQWYQGGRVKLAVRTARPRVLTADLEAINFKKPMVVFSTKYSEGQIGRSKNLRRIAALITGLEILPGKTFSYNKVVGERTPENGFFLAPEINEGRMQMAYGGGACQGSTTLFNAALLAGFDKFDWWPHSRRSHYADPGRDATVYYGQIDLIFRNPHKESVYIYATAEKGVMTFKLFSRHKLKYKVKLSSKWWGAWWPGEVRKVVKNLPPGKTRVVSSGAEGMQAALYRTFIYPDGKKVTKRMVNKGGKVLFYTGAKRIVEVGAGKPEEPKPTAKPAAAPAGEPVP